MSASLACSCHDVPVHGFAIYPKNYHSMSSVSCLKITEYKASKTQTPDLLWGSHFNPKRGYYTPIRDTRVMFYAKHESHDLDASLSIIASQFQREPASSAFQLKREPASIAFQPQREPTCPTFQHRCEPVSSANNRMRFAFSARL